MKVYGYQDASQFYDCVKDYLLFQEARHCLLLGICNSLIKNPKRYDSEPYLAAVEKDGNIIAVAIRTPPRKLLLSKMTDLVAVELIAEDLYKQQQKLPGVSSLPKEAEAFAQAWQNITGQSYKPDMQLRLHQLDTVQDVQQANGNLRLASISDRELLIDWIEAFYTEALESNEENASRAVDAFLSQNSFYIWESEIPVSIAGGRLLASNSGWIGPVYTPPQYRKKGYASSCVAAVSQALLDKGCKSCYLFTDQANPTSNHIYRTIGYQAVDDWYDYSFTTD
jgi:uncharacterized protein